jgi:hypothetical protein
MRPGTPGHFPKVVPPGGDTIQGTFIPEGTMVGMNIPSILRLEAVFGPDADLFRPERFVEADGDQRTEMERTVEMMFGSGRLDDAGSCGPSQNEDGKLIFFRWNQVDVCGQADRLHGAIQDVLRGKYADSKCLLARSRHIS